MHLVDTTTRQRCSTDARLTLVAAAPSARSRADGAAGLLLSWLRAAWNPELLRLRVRPRRKVLRVVETLHLGAKKQLVLVSCKGERFLVGTGADSVDTIVRVQPWTDKDACGERP